jgi:hypothetical protein
MAMPALDRINKTGINTRRAPVRPTINDEISKNVTRDPVYIYIGTSSLLILVLKSIRANNPRIKGDKFVIILLNKVPNDDIAIYNEKSIVEYIFLIL